MKILITKRQKELLSIIYEYIKDTGYPPSFEEMREKLRVSSNQSIIDLLEKLREKSFIKKETLGARSIALLPASYNILGKPPLVPFVGVSHAGPLAQSVEIVGEWLETKGDITKYNHEIFLLKVSGDSMINAGIDDGDKVLVKREKEFYSGDIVLAEINDESTIKRFISDDHPPFVYLKPENPKYPIIPFTEETRMTGKVISILTKNGYWKPIK